MKFLIDAQLPYGLKKFLSLKGYDVIHTDNLPNKERTTDNEIKDLSLAENRIVISKDSDFIDSFYVRGVPRKLLIISTGNIKNRDLFTLFENNMQHITELFSHNNLLEMDNFEIIVHE